MNGRAKTIELAREQLRRNTRNARRTGLALLAGAIVLFGAGSLIWELLK